MRALSGLFVQVKVTSPSRDEVRKRFDRIFRDYRQKGSPYYIDTLVIDYIAEDPRKDPPDPPLEYPRDYTKFVLETKKLNWIKDYLPHFENVFVGGIPQSTLFGEFPNYDITDPFHRQYHIDGNKYWLNEFILYLRTNNIAIPKIHWYINWEADLSPFNYADHYKDYISKFTEEMTAYSLDIGLNEPEFLWSPYFGSNDNFSPPGLMENIKSFLQDVPRLSWLHVQDGVGGYARKHSDGTITYCRLPRNVIDFYNNILVPASGNLKSIGINMELFVTKDPDGVNLETGDPFEHEDRICQYMRANVHIGASFEISYWYESVTNEIEVNLKNIFIDKGISFPASIRGVAHDLGLSPPISVKVVGRCLRHS